MAPSSSYISAIETLIADGIVHYQNKKTDLAEEAWQAALQQSTSFDYAAGAAKAGLHLAKRFRFKAQFKEAIAMAKNAVQQAKRSKDKLLLLDTQTELGHNLLMQRNYVAAATTYRLALALARKLQRIESQIDIHSQLAWLNRSTGNIHAAIANARLGLQLIENTTDHRLRATTLMGMGVLCNETGNDDMAVEYHLLCLNELEKGGMHQHMANCLDNLAESYASRMQWQKAEEYRLRALAIRQKGVNPYIMMLSHLGMARLYISTSRFDTAEENIKAAEKIANESKPELLYEVYKVRAEACQRMGQWEKALEYDLLYFKNRKKAGDAFEIAGAHQRMGECYSALENYTEAEKQLRKALQLAEQQRASAALEKTHLALANLATATGKHKSAAEHLKTYNHCREQRINANSEHRILLLQIQYESQKKDEEIAQLKEQLLSSPTSNSNQTYALSPRETEMLRELVAGESYKRIAAKLDVNYETVRTYIKRMYTKLGVATNTEAVAKAVKEKLV